MKSAFHQCLQSRLTGRAPNRSDKGIPLGHDFRVGWQAGNVYQPFCFRDCLFVEGGNAQREAGLDLQRV